MHLTFRASSLAALGLLAIPLLPAAQRTQLAPAVERVSAPFARISDTGERGYAMATFAQASFDVLADAHERPLTRLEGLPLPGGQSVDVLLRPVETWEAGGTAIVVDAEGVETRLAPSVRLFAGSVPGRASHLFLGVSPEMLHGYLSLDGENYVLSTGRDGGRTLAISHGDVFERADTPFCNVARDARDILPDFTPEPDMSAPKLRTTTVFIECDVSLRNRFSSDQATIDYATLLVGATSEIYRRDLGTLITIPNGNMRVWNSTAPWGNITTFGDLSSVVSWWPTGANSANSAKRAQVHVLSNPVFGGVANGLNYTCQNFNSYAISSVNGSFPFPVQHTSNSNWDLMGFSHETGHLYGSDHTFNYTPAITCQDGSGPDKGTIMSYCHTNFGIGQVGMRFHLRVQDELRLDLASKPCAIASTWKRGDYDADGAFEADDLAAFDAYRIQGFGSRGARDVFDMDADGDVDDDDRVILEGKTMFAKASNTVFNGSGANCGTCYTALTPPIIGTTWSTYVGGYFGPPILTKIIGTVNKLSPPVMTKFGELLVAATGFGGITVFESNAMTNFGVAQHDNFIPFDQSFAGLTLETQAALFKTTGIELLNGITVYSSTY